MGRRSNTWVGLDAYNWGSSSTCCVWEIFADLIDSPYQDYVGKKPIMLPETASAEVGGDKGAWITDMHNVVETQYTEIHAVVWFDINKETDWRIASSPSRSRCLQGDGARSVLQSMIRTGQQVGGVLLRGLALEARFAR